MRLKRDVIVYAAGILASGNLLLQGLVFIYRLQLGRLAGAEGLGVFRTVNSIYLVMHACCLAGTTTACTRLCADQSASNTHRGRTHSVLRMGLLFFGTLWCLCAAVLLLAGPRIATRCLGNIAYFQIFPVMLVCLLLTGVENVLKSMFLGLRRVAQPAVSEVGEQLIRIFAVGFLLRHFGGSGSVRDAFLIFVGMVFSELFSSIYLWFCWCRMNQHTDTLNTTGLPAGPFANIALPLAFSALSVNFLSSLNAIMLPQRLQLAGDSYEQAMVQIGLLTGMTLPILLLPAGLLGAACTATFPVLSAAFSSARRCRVQALTRRLLSVTAFIAFPLTALLIPLTPLFMLLLFQQECSMRAVLLLAVTVLCAYFQLSCGQMMNAIGLQHSYVVIQVCGELLQYALVYFLSASPALGIDGYLIALVLSGIAVTTTELLIVWREIRFPLSAYRLCGRQLLCALTIYFCTESFFAGFGSVLPQSAAAFCAAACAGLLYFALLQIMGVHLWSYLKQRSIS